MLRWGLSPRLVLAVSAGFLVALLAGAGALRAAQTTWVRIAHDALVGGGQVVYVNDMVPGDGSSPWLAVGYVVDGEGNREPSAWTSPSGVAWTRFAMEPTGSPEKRDGPFFVARRGEVTVAVGNRFDGRVRTAAWWSEEPSRWHALTSPSDPLLAFDGLIEGLDAGPEGFVAVGYEHFPSYSFVTVFTSEDGRSWRQTVGFGSSAGYRFQPYEVAAAPGQLVIVGDTASGAEGDGRIWVGEGGIAWSEVFPQEPRLDGPGQQQVASVAWDPTVGFVAGGMTMRRNVEIPTIWFSRDGANWQGTELEAGSPAAIHEVVSTPGGFFASGYSDAGPRLWRSSDGRSWTEIPVPPTLTRGGAVVRVASDGTKLVLVTTQQSGSHVFYRQGTDWVRGDTGPAFPARTTFAAELRDVASAKGRFVAVGSDGRQRPLVMVSRGGRTWRRVQFADSAARFLAVTSDRGGFTIAGWRLVRGRARLAIWDSRTGTTWRRLGGTVGDSIGAFVDVARDTSGLIAVALEPSQRGFVTSVWNRNRGLWSSRAILGPGEPSAVCVGPHGAVAVANVGGGLRSRVVVWTRPKRGRWSREAEIVAAPGEAARCADAKKGTVIVGVDNNGSATTWLRPRPGAPWRSSTLAATAPATTINDVIAFGSGFLATGTIGGRGQSDLAVWRSSDGERWSPVGGTEAPFVESGFQNGLGIVRTPDVTVVVGRHGAGNAGLWLGPP